MIPPAERMDEVRLNIRDLGVGVTGGRSIDIKWVGEGVCLMEDKSGGNSIEIEAK